MAVCAVLKPSLIVERIIPCFQTLANDTSDHVRSALGSILMKLSPILGRDLTIEHILPLFFMVLLLQI